MGTTFRAHHLRLDRDVVVKVLHPRLVDIEGNLERFAREARAAANLEHPNIVSIYDFDSDGDYHFIVMQYVKGQNLRHVIDNRGALGPRRAMWIAARVLEKAQSGEVLVSRTLTDLVAGSGLRFEDRGEHELKGVAEKWQLFAAAV